MKIEKGHYVAKELITSEAIHEAVVKCFVAAGFIDDRPALGGYDFMIKYGEAAGLAISNSGYILCGEHGKSAINPFTLQQLFTAENGLKWPDWAERISVSGECVAFAGGDRVEIISGSLIGVDGSFKILATRQPKEKEVNEAYDEMREALKTLDKRIIEEWSGVFKYEGYSIGNINFSGDFIKQRAKELGFIGKYRWGVEYATNGKRPELSDDVLISVAGKFINGNWYMHEFEPIGVDWKDSIKFKITDQRYKPADTSYLQTLAVEAVEEVAQGDWWDYENGTYNSVCPDGASVIVTEEDHAPLSEFGKTFLGKNCIVRSTFRNRHGFDMASVEKPDGECCCFIMRLIKPLDHATRKADLEKKRVVKDASYEFHKAQGLLCNEGIEALYDAGYLRLPANKD